MHINLDGNDGIIQSVNLMRLKNHKAIHHLDKLLSNKLKGHFNSLNEIHISNCTLHNEDYLSLKNIFSQCNKISTIELNSNHINSTNANNLFNELSKNHLKSFVFTDNWIGNKISSDFFDFLSIQQEIMHLDFSLNWLMDLGIANLMKSINTNIVKLNLSCNDFHSDGMMAISNFASNFPNLSELDVSYNHLDIASANYIAKLIKENNSIKSINVSSNVLTDGSAAIIAEALSQNTNAICLDVSDNKITNTGAKFLIESVIDGGVIRELNLKYNPIKQDQLRTLIQQITKKFPVSILI